MSEGVQAPPRAARGGLLVAGAGISVVIAVVQIGLWVNHWHIAEAFYAEAHVDGATTQSFDHDIIELLRSGNQNLLNGFMWLGITALCVLAAVVRRRRLSR